MYRTDHATWGSRHSGRRTRIADLADLADLLDLADLAALAALAALLDLADLADLLDLVVHNTAGAGDGDGGSVAWRAEHAPGTCHKTGPAAYVGQRQVNSALTQG